MRLRTAVLAPILLLAGCPAAESSGPPVAKPIEVATTRPRRRDVAREITLPVELWAWQRVSIVAKVSGYVGKIAVDRGSVVKEGEPLTTVAVPELDDERRKRVAEVKVADADLASAVANEELQGVTARRFASLLADHAVSVQEADEARARALVARAAVAQFQAKLASARENLTSTETWLAYGTLSAPFAGTITERWVHPGAFVSAAERTPLFEVVDARTIRAVVDVPEVDAPGIHVGKTAVRVILPELGGGPRAGVVSRSAAALDPKTRTLRIEIDLTNKDGDLLPGMYGQSVLVLEAHRDVLTVPSTAVFRVSGEALVFAVTEGKVRKKVVGVGLDDGKFAEITGLEPDATIAAQARGLSDGASVQPIEPDKKEKR